MNCPKCNTEMEEQGCPGCFGEGTIEDTGCGCEKCEANAIIETCEMCEGSGKIAICPSCNAKEVVKT